MVTSVTSFGRNGLSDWLIQRFSAVVLATYTAFIVIYLVAHPGLTYQEWSGLHSQLWMRIFTLIVLLSNVAHGWIGLWGVLTDYATDRLMGAIALPIRMFSMALYLLVALAFIIWGVQILWGVN
ncbi:MAG: succinate dehydrogenase, hydrophobic membrane anchor protein [Alteromonadaceae bacterium]|nr:MAG: succinate dehydrogenase, hydrophobic membrane anchor protein [Alteromonadaceae bacterium]